MKNGTFFDRIGSESASYWLGFFVADGHLAKNGRQSTFNLSSRDHDHLQKLADEFDLTVKSRDVYDKRTNKTYKNSNLTLCSKHLWQAINGLGVPRLKTAGLDGLVFNSIPGHLVNHFVRGYFDGDGCISKIGVAEFRLAICGTPDFLERTANVVRLGAAITGGAISNKKGVSTVVWCGTDRLNKIKEWLYDGATIWLERKRDTFEKMPKHRGRSRFQYVYWSEARNRWVSRQRINGKMRTIGQYKTEQEAADARTALGLPI